jgi:glycerol-3-phosphate O-acyltransferase
LVGELEGGAKEDESMLGLMRAWKFLQRRFGSVFVNFGEPLSLAEAIGDRRAQLEGDGEEASAARRVFVEQLGNRIVEQMNLAVVPHATSVAACALLGERRRGLFRAELALRMQQLVDLLRIMGVKLTPALARDEGDFSESIASLLRMDLIRVTEDARGEILFFEPGRRRVLDIYRNSILHYLAAPSFLARELLAGGSREAVAARLSEWLDVFHGEFFTTRGAALSAHVDAFLAHFEAHGWIAPRAGELHATELGEGHLVFLAEQMRAVLESYCVAISAVGQLEEPLGRKALRKRIGEQFERAALLGEAGLPEAQNPVTFGNAVDLLIRRGILAAAEPAGGDRRDPPFGRGPAWAELSGLRERLATALRAG